MLFTDSRVRRKPSNCLLGPSGKPLLEFRQTIYMRSRLVNYYFISILELWLRECQTLTAFLGSILTKKYTNPSSDIITILAGLDEVDQVFSDFVGVLDKIVRNGGSCKYTEPFLPSGDTEITCCK
jgi:hypothetical protein